MQHIIKFAVKNELRISEAWPIQGKHKYFVERHEGVVSHVGVIFEGVPVADAPSFGKAPAGSGVPNIISLKGNRVQEAVQSIRAWQSLLATYTIVDVDFDSISQEFKPESETERGQIHIPSFNSNRSDPGAKVLHDFSIFGRAFLAIDRGIDLVEPMAFFVEGWKALAAERLIDSYNYFFLFLESRFKLKHHNRLAAKQLLDRSEFCDAVEAILDDRVTNLSKGTKLPLEKWSRDKEAVALEIIELRGRLRHHSIGNPNRWNPTEQEKYRAEAVFLGAVCREIAKAGFDLTWEDQYVHSFVEQAKAMGMQLDVSVVLTIDEGTLPREVGMNFKLPHYEPSPMVAKAVLENALSEFNKRMPGAQLLGIRARIRPNGPELFRYDLGPGIRR